MQRENNNECSLSRRNLLKQCGTGLAAFGLAGILHDDRMLQASTTTPDEALNPLLAMPPHFPGKAKRVIHLFMNGGPSHVDTFDYKPELQKRDGQKLPFTLKTERKTGVALASPFKFKQYGESRAWVSDLLPYLSKVVDELCFIKSMNTEAINHDPAVTFFQTGSQQPGRPSMGSWLSYGLGSLNKNLPSFVVLLSRGTGRPKGQPLYSRLWGNGFLSSLHQGVQFRSAKDPVLFLKDPEIFPGKKEEKCWITCLSLMKNN